MEENIKNSNAKKNIILSLVICAFGLLLVGGTYAYFTMNFDATNSSIVTDTRCFSVNYTDNTDQITGVLWPSKNDSGGLSGSVTVQANSTCGVNGNGKLYLNVDSSSSEELTTSYTRPDRGYCLNKYTLEYAGRNAPTCNVSENYIWTHTFTTLRYAIYDSPARTNLYASGFIDESFVGTDKEILSDFSIDGTAKTFYIYIWMDGNLTGNNDSGDYSFSAQIKTGATQVTSEAREYPGDDYVVIDSSIYEYTLASDIYQTVEYIESTGTQYINTGASIFSGTNVNYGYNSFEIRASFPSFSNNNVIWGYSTGNGGYKSWVDSSGNWQAIYNNQSYGNSIGLTTNTGYRLGAYYEYDFDYDYKILHMTRYTFDYANYETSSNNEFQYSPLDGELYLFYDGTNYGKYRLHYVNIYWEDGNGYHYIYFQPVYRKSDNVAGLLDTREGKFYTNDGTGNFIVGPDIDEPLD